MEVIVRSNKPEVFVAASGAKLAYPARTDYTGSTYYSPEGETFYQLHDGGGRGRYSGDEIDEKRHFSAPQLGFEATAHRTNASVSFLEEIFTLCDEDFDQGKVTIVPLPDDRQIEYLCEAGDEFVYVSASRYEYDYDTFRLFIGTSKDMHEVPVTGVKRSRDGGTTTIDTPYGPFHSPAPCRTRYDGTPMPPRWRGVPLRRVEKDHYKDYEIVEDESGAVVSIEKR